MCAHKNFQYKWSSVNIFTKNFIYHRNTWESSFETQPRCSISVFSNWISSKMNQVNCCGRWKLFIFCGRLATRTFLNLSGSLDIHTKILTEGNTTYATDRVEAINLSKIEIWFENSWCASAALFEFVFLFNRFSTAVSE